MRYLGAVLAVLLLCAGCHAPTVTAGRPPATASTDIEATITVTPEPGEEDRLPSGPPLPTGPNTRPGERPPTFPESARRNDAAGARAFADYFLRVWDWSIATNNTQALVPLISANCMPCVELFGRIHDLRAGERLLGFRISWTFAKSGRDRDGTYWFDIGLNSGAGSIVDAHGAQVQRGAAQHLESELLVMWSRSGWIVDTFD